MAFFLCPKAKGVLSWAKQPGEHGMKLEGVFTALVTPFKDDLSLDKAGFASLVEWQISSGVSGVVPCGTTGESATLSFDEYSRVVRLCVEAVGHRALVMAGAGSNCTAETIRRVLFAQSVRADAVLLVTPYHNRPNSEGIYQHFKAIHDATDIPIVLYNIPKRTAIDMSDATIARIAELPRVVGIKDCTEVGRVVAIKKVVPEGFSVLSGEDETVSAFYANGGSGCVSVVSNIAPEAALELYQLLRLSKLDEAQSVSCNFLELSKALFCEPNPVPTKYALSLMGRISPKVRLPLVELADESKLLVRTTLERLNLLSAMAGAL
ncbi:MAG: 4-hydroxy-tetrahydrodipicolinate synthase [Anaplasma sp.]